MKSLTLNSLASISEEVANCVFTVLFKNFLDPPSNIDIIAEETAFTYLKEKYQVNVYSEEAGHICIGENAEFSIALDPLDGTTNYLAGIPIYAVSAAIASKTDASLIGDIDAATVISSLGLKFTVQKGTGVRINNQLVYHKQSKVIRVPYMQASSIFTPYRLLGASAIELCLTAIGSFDSFVDKGTLKATDVAGAQLVIKEAGGKITDLHGLDIGHKNLGERNLSVLASSPEKHKNILKKIVE